MRHVVVAVLLAATPVWAAEEPKRVEDFASRAFEMVNKGQYHEAIALYMKAYQLSPSAALLYNIAAVYDKRLQERDLAADFYRRYLKSVDADPDLARKAAARLEAIKEEQARANDKSVAVISDAPKAQPKPQPQAQPQPEPVAGGLREKAPEPPSPGMSGGRIAGIVIGGVGLAGIGVGLGFGANAKSLNEDALKYCTGKSCWDQKGVDLTNQAKTSATIATAGVVAGAIALVGGVVLAIASGGSAPESATTSSWMIVPTASPNGAGLLVQGDL